MKGDGWSFDEWWMWRWLNPWSPQPPPPHNGCGCIIWMLIWAVFWFILYWVWPLLF